MSSNYNDGNVALNCFGVKKSQQVHKGIGGVRRKVWKGELSGGKR